MTHDPQKLATGRKWITVSAASFDAIPSVLPFSYETFVLLLAADARGASDQALRKSCSQLLTAGGPNSRCWGGLCWPAPHPPAPSAAATGRKQREAGTITNRAAPGPLRAGLWFSGEAR